MTKKSLNKLLSVVLALAICFTTVFGCLITANAAVDECCAKWSEGAATKELDKATIYLAFNAVDEVAAEGFSAITFALDAHEELKLQDVKAVATVDGFASTVLKDGSAFDADDIDAVFSTNEKDVVVDSGNAKAYSTIVLEFTFGFVGGTATQGKEYGLSVTDIRLDNAFATHKCNNGEVKGVIKASCDHVIAVNGNPVNTDDINGYTVYENSYCTLCGEKFGYQLVPTTEAMDGVTISWDGSDDNTLVDAEDGEQLGTSESPIIINSAEELHYLATAAGREETFNNYYKMADGIKNVVLQSADKVNTILYSDGFEVTDLNDGTYEKWSVNASTDVTKAFAGHFDGNGVTVYGLYAYQEGAYPVGLFPTVHTGEINTTMDTTIANNYTPYTSSNPASAALTKEEKVVRVTADERVVISGVNITKSYIYGTIYMGFIVGTGLSNNTYKEDYWVDVDNCSVYNNYMQTSYTDASAVARNGLLAGYGACGSVKRYYGTEGKSESSWLAHCGMTFDNCLVYGNTTVANDKNGNAYDYGIGAMAETCMGTTNIFTDSIILGTTPYLSTATVNGTSNQGYSSHRSLPDRFKNVYTDANLQAKYNNPKTIDYSTGAVDGTVDANYVGRIKQITADSILGYNAVTACPEFAWGSTWSYGAEGEYPSLASGGSTILYWSGEADSDVADNKETGSVDNPIIIDSPEELYQVALKTSFSSTTADVLNYKIADGIDAFVLQPVDKIIAMGGVERLMSLSGGKDVEEYFTEMTNAGIEPINWCSSVANVFNGNFDGNGIEIYGLYATGNTVGLFPQADGGAQKYDFTYKKWDSSVGANVDVQGKADDTGVFYKNFAIKNSYFNADGSNCRVGAVAGIGYGTGFGPKVAGIFNMENIEVSNCYMYAAKALNGAKGVFFGEGGSDWVRMNNCLVYGNTATDVNGTTLKLVGSYTDTNTVNGKPVSYALTNSIILGTEPTSYDKKIMGSEYIESVYTDQNVSSFGLADTDIKQLTSEADAIGTQAKDNMPGLEWKKDWYTNIGGYPTLVALDETRVNTTSNGAFGLTAYNTAYNNDGSLDFNFYFNAQTGYDYKLYVGKTDKSGYTTFLTISPVAVENDNIIEQLGENAMVATIPNLSSRDINTVWVPTLVATNGAVTEWGMSKQIALADYANGVLNGEGVYASDEDKAKYEEADKKVAAALLNYADAATKALNAPVDTPTAKNTTVYWSINAPQETFATLADKKDGSEDGKSWETAIIIDNAEELYYLCRKSTHIETKGLYFKVAEHIKNFVLQDSSVVDADYLMSLTDASVIKQYLEELGSNLRIWSESNGSFDGNFDGNGATIYGMYCEGNHTGLFGGISCGIKDENSYYDRITTVKNSDGEVTGTKTTRYYTDDIGIVIKNVNVKNAYMKTGWRLGGIVAYTNGSGYGADVSGVINIDNCVVANCYFTNTDTNTNSKGIFIGGMGVADIYDITGCIAYGNVAYMTDGSSYKNRTLCVAGGTPDRWYPNDDHTLTYNDPDANDYGVKNERNVNKVNYSILVDCMPHTGSATWSNASIDSMNYVYSNLSAAKLVHTSASFNHTDADVAITEDISTLIGAAAQTTCPSLDWNSGWMITAGYPQPVQSGYTAPEGGKTLYWNGEVDQNLTDEYHEGTTQDGTAANPIIIDSAEELACLGGRKNNGTIVGGPTVTQFYTTAEDGTITFTAPKHFKIADGIDKIVLQKENCVDDILSLSSAEETRKYFTGETGVATSNFTMWTGSCAWQGNYTAGKTTYDKMDSFCGVLDGNNVEIYGIYQSGSYYGGLFGDIDLEATVKNLTVKNSYIHASYNASSANAHRAGVIFGFASTFSGKQETATISKCTVTNCYVSQGYDKKSEVGVLAGNLSNAQLVVEDCLVYGNEAYYDTEQTSTKKVANLIGDVNSIVNSKIKNSIILDTVPTVSNKTNSADFFSNVYTDQTTTFSTVTKVDDINTLKGTMAADIVKKLGDAWYVGAAGDYPGFSEADVLPSIYRAEYDALVLDKLNISPNGGTENFGFYSASINLRANPYISFIFNFGEDYKTNRSDITVTFTYTVGGQELTRTVNVPAYEEDKDLKADGWSNLSYSKKHTYQFTDLPVQALVNGVNVVIKYNDESVDCGTYSAIGTANAFVNANKKAPCSYYALCAEATKALVYYTQALTARYGN